MKKNKKFCILGDINISINGTNQLSSQAEKYLQAITSNGAFSLISKSTQVTDKLATVIDHIITCYNFAYFSMLIILSWRPKGEAMAQCPLLLLPCLVI